jgi:hypothetical protein
MTINTNTRFIVSVALALCAVAAFPAHAADADWVQPVNDGVKSLTASLIAVGGGVIGICIVGYAIWGAVKQRLEMTAIVTLFICGLLVGIGPTAIIWWIGLFGKTS